MFQRQGSGWVEQVKLAASDPGVDDGLGDSVAVEGDVVVAGAPYTGTFSSIGKAYIFEREGDTWTETKLVSSGSDSGDYFGCSVSISGDRAVVGAFLDKGGRAYVFRRDGPDWIEEAVLGDSGIPIWGRFGTSVSIRGNAVVVGAPYTDDACPDDPPCESGSAYVFRYDGDTWVQEAKLTASDAAAGDHFGSAVSLDADMVVVGASRDDDVGTNSGSAYLFRREGVDWIEEGKVTADDGRGPAQFGYSASIKDGVIAVGAPFDVYMGADNGSAYLFQREGSTWHQTDRLIPVDSPALLIHGRTVSIYGGDLAVGGAGAYIYAGNPLIPTMSEWGMSAMGLLLLAAGMIVVARRSRVRAEG